jgi:murein DD-endopeptidase MepM/ murein hydrolase activator NlpD
VGQCIHLTILILLIAAIGCSGPSAPASCHKTTRNFVKFFNSKDFRSIASLFERDALNTRQYKKMSNNLTYIYGVAGSIQSLQFTGQEGSTLTYKSVHEKTAMDVIFQVNDYCKLNSYVIKTHYPDSLKQLERNLTSLKLPLMGEWFVKWGGPTIEQNYHNGHRNMRGAFDFVKHDEQGRTHKDQGKKNDDYYAFDQPVTAPCQAAVVKVIDGIEDNSISRTNTLQTYGNAIVLRTPNQEYLLLAHLKNQSIVVKEGQQVNEGDLLASVGNSGYSTEPHLHFIVQNVADLFHPTGAKCYFDDVLINGTLRQDYSPVQGELVSNLKP